MSYEKMEKSIFQVKVEGKKGEVESRYIDWVKNIISLSEDRDAWRCHIMRDDL